MPWGGVRGPGCSVNPEERLTLVAAQGCPVSLLCPWPSRDCALIPSLMGTQLLQRATPHPTLLSQSDRHQSGAVQER